MSITAQKGIFGWAPQIARGTLGTTWYRHKSISVDFGAVQEVGQFPPEVGGTCLPTGSFKAGAFVAGGAVIAPRMEGDLGWLLYALMGNACDVTSYGGESGVFGHVFYPAAADDTIPWLSARKYIPGPEGDDIVTIGQDCKMTGMTITIPQAGILQARPVLVGRIPTWDRDPSLSWEDTAEGPASVPISCVGGFRLPTFSASELPVTGVSIDILNTLTTPQDERIVGSYYPDDFAVRTRVARIRFVLKWANPDLYQAIYTASTTGEAWSPAVYSSDVELIAQSPANITGKNQPYALKITAPSVDWQMEGPPQLVGGQIVQAMVTGIVQEPASGDPQDWLLLTMVNAQAAYVWPTE